MFAPSAPLGRALCVAATAAAWSRGGAPPVRSQSIRRAADDGAPLPTVEEAIAGAEGYDGPGIVDPYYMHPDTYPMLHDWTAERFDCDLESGGYAEWAAQDDRGDVVASVVAVVGGDAASAAALVAADPLVRAGVFDEARSGAYHWTIAGDPYLQADVWPDGESPGASADWAAADPYVDAGVFGDGVQPLAAATYCELDVTGTQLTRPPPLNELPDPLLQRLVDADLVTLKERQVQRIEADPKTGEFVRYNITTTDPRVLSNVDVDDGLMATFASTPKALRAKKAREKKRGGGRLAALSEAEGDDAAENDDGDPRRAGKGGSCA
ncbi:hypothetical protein JL721_11589 [Aureococcus anophagefferens]|nr:hypothetical protein JL721_11589 [Aureococcus anophagefferens]